MKCKDMIQQLVDTTALDLLTYDGYTVLFSPNEYKKNDQIIVKHFQ